MEIHTHKGLMPLAGQPHFFFWGGVFLLSCTSGEHCVYLSSELANNEGGSSLEKHPKVHLCFRFQDVSARGDVRSMVSDITLESGVTVGSVVLNYLPYLEFDTTDEEVQRETEAVLNNVLGQAGSEVHRGLLKYLQETGESSAWGLWYLEYIYIIPKYQGKGMGTATLRRVIEGVRENHPLSSWFVAYTGSFPENDEEKERKGNTKEFFRKAGLLLVPGTERVFLWPLEQVFPARDRE